MEHIVIIGGGGTGAAPEVSKKNISVPTMPALARARRHLDNLGSDATLIITGGLRHEGDFAKALALGADGVQIGSRFAISVESSGHAHYKQAVVDAGPADTHLVMKALVPVRVLKRALRAIPTSRDAKREGREELAAALGLESPPRDIACFDISTLSGRDSVGSSVWLRDGVPRKKEYRRFRIRETNDGQTDAFSMMQEVVGRYFARRVTKGETIPDLVVIDGGKGQLGAARHAMESAGVSDIPVVALAKRLEEVFVPGSRDPLILDRRNQGLRWLQRARDEAHRFAIDYNRCILCGLCTRVCDHIGVSAIASSPW